jgi:hypothetical protein
MHRRHMLLALAAAAVPGAALADIQRVPLSKAFGLLDTYLALPVGERNRFYLAYRAMKDKHPYPGAAATVVSVTGARFPVQFDASGLVLRLPSLSDLKSGAMFESADPGLRLGLEARAAIAPATRIDVGALVLALAQANAAVAKIAGPLALMAPKLTAAYFPDAGAGSAQLADGRTVPLPITNAPFVGAVTYIEPALLAGARTVVLTRAPSRILIGGHPKG